MHTCIMVYKCLSGMAPQYLNDKITFNDNIHKYCTRSAEFSSKWNTGIQQSIRSY